MKLTGNSMVFVKNKINFTFCELFCITIIRSIKKIIFDEIVKNNFKVKHKII